MAVQATTGATLKCTFGSTPASLIVSSQTTVIMSTPAATIKDCASFNIPPFGMCSSLANPAVSAATTAALGVLTPQPCTPVPSGSWNSEKLNVSIGGSPCLTSNGSIVCACGGGQITFASPGQSKVRT